MRIRTLVLAASVISSCGLQMRSQMSGPPPSPPLGSNEDPAKAVDGLLSLMEFQVMGAAKAMPADKYSFAPAQGIFAGGRTTQFDTVRTFVAQATITAENAFVTIKPIDGFSTRTTIAAFAAAHGYDHYGQMVEYLRMNGIVPPASAK